MVLEKTGRFVRPFFFISGEDPEFLAAEARPERPGKISVMETNVRKGPAELETIRMAAVLNASYPRRWRFKTSYFRSDSGYRAYAHIEWFDGVYWRGVKLISGDWTPERDDAFRSMLASWAGKSSWTETVRNTTLPRPPAMSTEELCLKLSLLENAS